MSLLRAGALAAGLVASAPAAAQDATVRRFALLAGANDGGAERVPLVYAGSDARTVAQVLARYGGVSPGDTIVLTDPDKDGLEAAFGELSRRIAASGGGHRRTEVVVYYSGHSDGQGLLLAGERIPYRDLRAWLDALPADVRVAILDSCASGALVRGKGGVAVPGFLVEEGSDVEGHAFLTSSSADEISQEADALGGSFFTHALVTGLRGGADTDLDGQVTLNEAYRFAYDETLARTEGTRYGPQHAAFDIQLSGSGDLVMTDLRERAAGLRIGPDVQGLIMVRDRDGRLVAELRKPEGRPVDLRLDPGAYTVVARSAEGTWRARAEVGGGSLATLGQADFSGFALADARARGDAGPAPRADSEPDRIVPFSAMLFPSDLSSDPAVRERHEGAVGVVTRAWQIDGPSVAVGANWADDGGVGAQIAVGANVSGGDLAGFQGAAGLNVTRGDVHAQGAAGVNVATGRASMQASALGNWAGEVLGFQGAAGANIAQDGLRGFQGSAGANIAGGQAEGLQAAAGANVAERIQGVQIAAGANIAGSLRGLQLGVVNAASGDDNQGLQVGVVNVAGDLRGGMIGVVNVAESVEGVPLGLLHIIDDGIFDMEAWADSTGALMGGVKSGSKRIYTALGVGATPDQLGQRGEVWHLTAGAALGGRFGPTRLPVDVDAGLWVLSDPTAGEAPVLIPRVRGSVGPRLHKNFVPFIGVDLSLGIPLGEATAPTPLWTRSDSGSDTGMTFWPGVFAGVRI